MRFHLCILILLIAFVGIAYCQTDDETSNETQDINSGEYEDMDKMAELATELKKKYIHVDETIQSGYVIESIFYHNSSCFTQGIVFDPSTGNIIESCGLYDRSHIKIYNPVQKKVFFRRAFPDTVFAEGIALHKDHLIALTWREKVGFHFRLKGKTLKQLGSFPFKTSNKEGWGATTVHFNETDYFLVSDGTCNLMLWDTATYKEIERKCIKDPSAGDAPVVYLNALQFIKGYIYANVWMKNKIAVIDWGKGEVIRWIDLSYLTSFIKIPSDSFAQTNAVMNGIAYDEKEDALYITGKFWNRLFKIHLLV